jgi:DNA repair exonuclease SbcCD nuclease subunit
MKVAIITDQHFGCRKNSKLFHDYFLKFYEEVFFPTLEEQNIKTVIDMGDTFDSRKGIDFAALAWAKNHYYDRLQSLGCTVYTVVGNHTAYYKNTNEVNAVDLLLREYENVKVISQPSEYTIDQLKVLFIPWINPDNEEQTLRIIKRTKANVAMGHLELHGFRVNRGIVMDHGMDAKIFSKFDRVYSGHYHTRSNQKNVYYLGNPYEMYWNDVGDTRGFHIFDTETLEHTPINNPFRMFYNIYYEDTPYQMFDTTEYQNKIVKVIVRKKSDTKKFEKFIDKLYSSNIFELKVVENFQIEEGEEFEAFESENTISILNRYIEEAEVSLDKSIIQKILQEVYQEACELV